MYRSACTVSLMEIFFIYHTVKVLLFYLSTISIPFSIFNKFWLVRRQRNTYTTIIHLSRLNSRFVREVLVGSRVVKRADW